MEGIFTLEEVDGFITYYIAPTPGKRGLTQINRKLIEGELSHGYARLDIDNDFHNPQFLGIGFYNRITTMDNPDWSGNAFDDFNPDETPEKSIRDFNHISLANVPDDITKNDLVEIPPTIYRYLDPEFEPIEQQEQQTKHKIKLPPELKALKQDREKDEK